MHFKQRSFIWKMVMKVLPFGSTLNRCGLAIVIPFFAIVEFFSCLMVDKDLNCISQIWEHWFGNYIYWRKWRLSRQLGALLDVLYFNMSHCPCIVGLNARLSFVLSWHKAPPLITLEFAFQSIRPYPYTHFSQNLMCNVDYNAFCKISSLSEFTTETP